MGQGGRHGSSSLRHNGRTKRFPLLPPETIRPGSSPHAGWRGWLERGSKVLFKCGTISYRTANMRGLFSVAQTPRNSALSQVTIRPGSAPPRVERVAGEGILHSVETQHGRCGRKTCADCSPSLKRLGPLPSPRCRGQFPNYPSLPSLQNPRVGKTSMMIDNTKKSRKVTSWLLGLDKRKNNVITQNAVGCGELTAMVTD